ncbi:hypothetical protein CISIN_1g0481952mg, partial [Citrus sinensis]
NPFPPKKDLGIKDLKLSLELLKPWLLCKVLRSKIFTEISSHQVLLEETPKSFLAATPHNFIAKVNLMDGGGCTALDISDDLSQAGKTEMKIKATQRVWGAFGAKYDQMRKIFKWGRLIYDILFNEFPLKPLLLVSVFSMLAAYLCMI